MISVEGLKVEFGVKPLFHDVSFVINDRDRIALVGKNGAGKSTMLKILCGLQKPTDGIVAIPNETTIGYLPQVMKLQDDTTVKEETRKAFAHNTEMKARLDKMQQEMAERTVEASSGGGMVKVVATCKQDIVSITIDPKALEGGDVEMLQDLVLTAVNEAVRIGRATMDREVSAITGGIKLPGII